MVVGSAILLVYIITLVLSFINVALFWKVLLFDDHVMITFYLFVFLVLLIRILQAITVTYSNQKILPTYVESIASTIASMVLGLVIIVNIVEYN